MSHSTETLCLPPLRGYQLPVMYSTARDDLTISVPQAGKSTAAAEWLLTAAWYGGASPAPWWWTAPTHAICSTGFNKRLVWMAKEAGIVKRATTSPPFKCELINGALIEGRSWDQPDGLAGETIRGAVIDEFGQMTQAAYKQMSARRAETVTRGEGFFRWLGNVGEVGGEAETLWNRAESGAPGFACRRWTWRDRALDHHCSCHQKIRPPELNQQHAADCIRGIYVDFVSEEAARMSKAEFQQLYEAEWVDWTQLPAYTFVRDRHVDESKCQFDPNLPIDLACDFNVDPMAWVIGQHRGDIAWVLDEISIEGGATTAAACREFIRRFPDSNTEVIVYGDRTGRSRDTRNNVSDYDIIKTMIGGHYPRFSMRVPRNNPAVTDRLNAVNAKLENALGVTTYWVHPRAAKTANDYARVSLKPGTRDIQKTGAAKNLSHYSDADGYRLHYLYGGVTIDKRPTIEVGTVKKSRGNNDVGSMRF